MGCVNNNAAMNPNQPRIIIKPTMAALTRDTETLGNMDPYCKVFLGGQQRQTPVCNQGGKQPKWGTSLVFATSDKNLRIQVWDKDNLTDDLIGSGSLNLSTLNLMLPSQDVWIDLVFQNKPVGRVQVNISNGQQPINSMGQPNVINLGATVPQYGVQPQIIQPMPMQPMQPMGMMPNQPMIMVPQQPMQPMGMMPGMGMRPLDNGWNQI